METSGILASEEWGPAKEAMGQATRTVLPIDQVAILKLRAKTAFDIMLCLMTSCQTAVLCTTLASFFSCVFLKWQRRCERDLVPPRRVHGRDPPPLAPVVPK